MLFHPFCLFKSLCHLCHLLLQQSTHFRITSQCLNHFVAFSPGHLRNFQLSGSCEDRIFSPLCAESGKTNLFRSYACNLWELLLQKYVHSSTHREPLCQLTLAVLTEVLFYFSRNFGEDKLKFCHKIPQKKINKKSD